eukprot:Skav222387  [mRNA]  locus=scaffold1202:17653:28987:- [translate_table: standard]
MRYCSWTLPGSDRDHEGQHRINGAKLSGVISKINDLGSAKVGTLGGCRAILAGSPGRRREQDVWDVDSWDAGRSGTGASWQARLLAPETGANLASLRRLRAAYAPLGAVDMATGAVQRGGVFHASSPSMEQLAPWHAVCFLGHAKAVHVKNGLLLQGDVTSVHQDAAEPLERLLLRIERAAHPFAALGGGAARQALAECEQKLSNGEGPLAERMASALARVRDAAAEIESFLSMDTYVTQILAELYYLVDEEGGIPSPKRAAALLGVEVGCGDAAAQAGQFGKEFDAVAFDLEAGVPAATATSSPKLSKALHRKFRFLLQTPRTPHFSLHFFLFLHFSAFSFCISLLGEALVAQVGGLSDIFTTPRGVHILYRLA